jgi:drug/metabolite transporter (DMT)-like permease
MVLLMAALRQPWPRGRDLLILLGMGAIGYAGQAFCFFSALHHATAGLTGLLLYLYPALVILASALLGRRKLTLGKSLLALLSLLGILLTVSDGLAGTPLGIAFGVGAAVVYTVYILVGEGVSGRTGANSAGCVIMIAAALVFGCAMLLDGPQPPQSIDGWMAVVAIAIFSTLMPIVFFFAGMRHLGAGDASTLSTLEPVVTLLLAYLFLGEILGASAALGGHSGHCRRGSPHQDALSPPPLAPSPQLQVFFLCFSLSSKRRCVIVVGGLDVVVCRGVAAWKSQTAHSEVMS